MRQFSISVLAFLLLLMGAGSKAARAVPGVFHPDLLRALDKLDHAQGPEAYGAVDRIWSLWDRAEASQIEEALLGASENAKLGPEPRAYAGVLAAFARARRGDQKAATARVRALGYVSNFLVVGSVRQRGQGGARAGVRARGRSQRAHHARPRLQRQRAPGALPSRG